MSGRSIRLLLWSYPFALLWMVQSHPFFWDTVQLGSKHAHFFYENGLTWTLLPAEIDSGHPPFFGYYLALCWHFLGKTLAVSHWAMLPFLLLITAMQQRIAQRLHLEPWQNLLFFGIIMLDPVIAGQSSLVSPDIVLLGFFLLALDSLETKNHWPAALGILGLCAISMRGMMVASALVLWYFITNFQDFKNQFRPWIRTIMMVLPGVCLGLGYLYWHYKQSGWVGYHAGSPWAPAFNPVGMHGFLRNIGILGWRWLDLGRFAEWMAVAWVIYRYGVPKIMTQHRSVVILLCCLILFLSPSALFYQGLSAHRYFMPAFFALHLLAGSIWAAKQLPNAWASILFIALLSGNCWIYPRGVSMDWDATLAHWPYFKLRTQMEAYLKEKQVNPKVVGSAFPNLNTGEDLSLNGEKEIYAPKDADSLQFMFCSNIFNDFDEADYHFLQGPDWRLEKRLEQQGIWVELYTRKQQ